MKPGSMTSRAPDAIIVPPLTRLIPMLTLRHSPASPFVRKVRIAASLLGLEGEIKLENADAMDAGDSLRQQNPLGKIPALLLEDGTVLFDSRVILEFLDQRAGGGRIVPT